MKHIIKLLLACCILLGVSCKEVNTLRPFGQDDGNAPGIVTLDSYEAIPGGIKIKYIPPKDEDLLYVKAKYTLDTGKSFEARGSLYSNELEIEGFGNTQPKTIRLSAVDRFENTGEEIIFDVIPGLPACVAAHNMLETDATFGGVSIKTRNESKALLHIEISTKNEEGQWYEAYSEYTSIDSISFALRGFESNPRDFKVVIKDRWGNSSEEYLTTVTPWFEEELNRSNFKSVKLPGDLKMDAFGSIEHLFNGNLKWGDLNVAHSPDFEEFPVWFTFDMGTKARLSRYKFWQRLQDEFFYDHGAIKDWEVWGCVDQPDPTGSWNGWIRLMTCQSFKPSGWPLGSDSEEDKEYAKKGEEFVFPIDIPAVRYIRIKVLSTYADKGLVHIQQLHFWGERVE